MAKPRTTITSWLKCGGLALALDFIGADFMTLKCTYWLKTGHDDWTGQDTYSAPVVARCWYKKDFKLIRNERGEEVAAKAMYLSDELTPVTNGSYIAFGESVEADPIIAGASVVIGVGLVPADALGSSDLNKVYV